MQDRYPFAEAIPSQLHQLISRHRGDASVQSIPEAVELLVCSLGDDDIHGLAAALASWAPMPLLSAISLMSSSAAR